MNVKSFIVGRSSFIEKAKTPAGRRSLCRGRPKPFWPVRCRPARGARRLPKRTAVARRPAFAVRNKAPLRRGAGSIAD
nr:MAG TPA: hypothetical protein [Caudoviricetes sp.]